MQIAQISLINLIELSYFHETDEIDFKDQYEGRRINNTYLFGNRLINKNK